MIERHISLRKAARDVGVDRSTMKRWLEEELGFKFPRVRHGAKLLVAEADVLRVLARRKDVRALPPPEFGRKRKKNAA